MAKFYGFFIFVAVLATAQSMVPNRSESSGRIFGGEEIEPHSAPFVAALYSESGGELVVRCGASILNEDTLLTAARCPTPVKVGAGKHRLSETEESEQIVEVAEYIRHSLFVVGSDFKDYNIAIIKLAEPLKPTYEVQAVRLPDPKEEPEEFLFKEADVFGWGRAHEDTGTDELRGVTVEVGSDNFCKIAYNEYYFPRQMMCAGVDKGICSGDYGGPLVLSGTDIQIGIASFYITCGDDFYPSVFTETQTFLEFIYEHL